MSFELDRSSYYFNDYEVGGYSASDCQQIEVSTSSSSVPVCVIGKSGVISKVRSIPKSRKYYLPIEPLGSEQVDNEEVDILEEIKWNEYYRYLTKLTDSNLNPFVIDSIPKIRNQLSNVMNQYVKPPRLSTSEDVGVVLAWDFGSFYLSVDVLTTGSIEWFLKNTITGEYWGEVGQSVDDFPPSNLREKLLSLTTNLIKG